MNMEQHEIASKTLDYGFDSHSADLEHDDLVNDIRGIATQSLWRPGQAPRRRRSSSCHSSDDTASHSDSSSMSSKYNSDFDSDHSTGTHSPATSSWSSHCDEACDHHETSMKSLGKTTTTTTEQHTTSLREATTAGQRPTKLSIDTQNLPPWDAMFPDWYQCASPGPIIQLGTAWAALKDTNMQGMWTPPPPPPAGGGLWGM